MTATKSLKNWNREYLLQKKKHPSLQDWPVRRVATDHVKKGRMAKGGILDWVYALFGLLLVSILWIVFSSRLFYPLLVPMAAEITDPEAVATMSLFNTMWTFWPVVIFIGFILLVFLAGQRRSPESY
jgi:hypothetical protein